MKLDKKLVMFTGIFLVGSACLLLFYPEFKEESEESVLPDERMEHSKKRGQVAVFEKSVEVEQRDLDVKGTQIHIRSVGKQSSFPVLLLHGQAFDSGTWETLGTLKAIGQTGFHGVAVDLPSFGKSKPLRTDVKPENFLNDLILSLDLHKPVIISPSMSGRYSVPYVIRMSNKVSGYVPISPVISTEYKMEDFKKCNVSTLIIYGEKDPSAADRNRLLSSIPNSRTEMIPNGKHPCYLDDPELFHKLVIDYLNSLKK